MDFKVYEGALFENVVCYEYLIVFMKGFKCLFRYYSGFCNMSFILPYQQHLIFLRVALKLLLSARHWKKLSKRLARLTLLQQ
jgi:hypothetical protein